MIVTPTISASPAKITSEYKSLHPGQTLDLEWEAPGQDGFDYMASTIRP